MHMNSDLRDPIIEAFDYECPSPDRVIASLGGPEKARHALGRLCKCHDILPGYIIDYIRLDWPDCEDLRGSYGALAQWMIHRM